MIRTLPSSTLFPYTTLFRSFRPGTYYYVGGSSKLYGGAMLRLRERDFEELEHADGVSPAWPISYRQLAPYYDLDRKSTRLNSSHTVISYAVFCLKKKNTTTNCRYTHTICKLFPIKAVMSLDCPTEHQSSS